MRLHSTALDGAYAVGVLDAWKARVLRFDLTVEQSSHGERCLHGK
jgi:hypothetical protein